MAQLKLIPEYVLKKNSIEELLSFFKTKNTSKVSLIYGGGSIKKNGLYDQIIAITSDLKIDIQEINGIQPNPLASSIWEASIKIRQFQPDYIIAAGGGSVIDASKIISILANNPLYKSVEDYFENSSKIESDCIPIISIITLSGTASENNAGSVVTFDKTKTKRAIATPSGVPVLVIEDPTYTYTVNKWQTASGSFDCFSHLLEQYYSQDLFDWTKQYLFSNMRNVLKYAPIAYHDPENYEARENLMFTSSMSLNEISSFKTSGDWNVHIMEHAISGRWDVTHGAGLALITPHYIRYRSKNYPWFKEMTLNLGKEVFGVTTIEGVIGFIEKFISSLNLPTTWLDFKEISSIDEVDYEWLLKHITVVGAKLPIEDYAQIFKNIPINKRN